MTFRSLILSAAIILAPAANLYAQAVRVVVEFSGDPDPVVVGGQLIRVEDNSVIAILPVAAAVRLANNPGIASVREDGIATVLGGGAGAQGKPGGGTTQPPQSTPWGVDRIDAPLAWGLSRGAGVRVAIVDTGIDNGHPDFKNAAGVSRVVLGPNFVTPSKTSKDDHGHGTHCAGTVGASDNTIGVIGVAPDCELYAVKVLSRSGSGYFSDIAAGINAAVANNAKVISLSLGGTYNDPSVAAAVANAWAAGVVVCAAAGNDGANGNPVSYPGAYAQAIAVAASDSSDAVAYFSTRGYYVDVIAPGVNVLSTTKGGGYAAWNGTSMATPHVAGTAALLFGSGVATASGVRSLIEGTADDLGPAGWDSGSGLGLIDAQEAVTGTQTLP